MIYFSTLDDIKHMESLLDNFERIIEIEQHVNMRLKEEKTNFLTSYAAFKHIREEASKTNPEYQKLRATYAKLISRANEICTQNTISWNRKISLPSLEGGGTIQGSIFEFVLHRESSLIDFDTDVRDTINKALGVLERKASNEFKNLVNPFYWFLQAFFFVVRLPYNLLKLSGFDIDEIQKHLIARFFQLIYVIVLILILVWFGLVSIIDLKTLLTP